VREGRGDLEEGSRGLLCNLQSKSRKSLRKTRYQNLGRRGTEGNIMGGRLKMGSDGTCLSGSRIHRKLGTEFERGGGGGGVETFATYLINDAIS